MKTISISVCPVLESMYNNLHRTFGVNFSEKTNLCWYFVILFDFDRTKLLKPVDAITLKANYVTHTWQGTSIFKSLFSKSLFNTCLKGTEFNITESCVFM